MGKQLFDLRTLSKYPGFRESELIRHAGITGPDISAYVEARWKHSAFYVLLLFEH